MEPVKIRLPLAADLVFNYLFRTSDPSLLTADLLGIALPGEYFIDVSWYPEGNPKGRYIITLYRKSWDHREGEYQTHLLDEVVALVESLAKKYGESTTSGTVTWAYLEWSQPRQSRRLSAKASV